MIPVTTATKNALKQPVKQIRATVSWPTSASQTATITSEDSLISLKKEAEGRYLQSTLRKITIVTTAGIELLDKKATVTVQVKTGANSWGNIPWGSFMITEMVQDQEKGIVTFTGYGGIATLQNTEYSTGELTFPTTVGGLITQIGDKFGLEIDPGMKQIAPGYKRVEYLESSGTQYIDTGIKGDLETAIDYSFVQLTDSTNHTCTLMGDASTLTTAISPNFATTGNSASVNTRFGDQATQLAGVKIEMGQRYTVHEDKNQLNINGANFWEVGATTAFTTAGNIHIARINGFASAYVDGTARIYYARISKNGVVIADYVPCVRTSDSKAGLYDLVTGTFKANAGTGDFTAGPDTYNLPNVAAEIPEDLWGNISGTTYRDILEEIAGATATIAVIGGGDDTLDFRTAPISAASETLTEANLITSKVAEEWGKASSVVLSRQPQNDNVAAVDEYLVQSGTGKNLFDGVLESGYWNNTTGEAQAGASGVRSANAIMVEPNTNYVLSVNGAAYNQNIRFLFYSKSGAYLGVDTSILSTGAITTPADAYQMKFHSSGLKTDYPDNDELIQVEKGSTITAYEPYTANGRVDLVIANNQILDEQREITAQPILDAVKDWYYRNGQIKTEGHGYHEIGDRIDITIGAETYPLVITKSTILVDGGINETLTSQTPDVVPINYSKSGGITKTIFRTELEVDKQEQRIDSIVSRQDATDASVAEQFTQVTQNLTNIVTTVQSTGGGNFIRNSVGFGKDSNGILSVWTYGTGASATTVKSQSSPASLNAGGVSGHEIMMTGASIISQTVELTPGETYTLALRAKKNTTGAITIQVGNTSNSATITLASGTAYNWQLQKTEFVPAMSNNTVKITVPASASFEITDLILTTGGGYTWRQASGEIYNTQVSLDQSGVQVKSSVDTGDYVEITPLEFAGYSNASGSMQKVFSLNRDVTEVEKLEARSQIKMPPIKVIPIDNSSYSGWAFVKEA